MVSVGLCVCMVGGGGNESLPPWNCKKLLNSFNIKTIYTFLSKNLIISNYYYIVYTYATESHQWDIQKENIQYRRTKIKYKPYDRTLEGGSSYLFTTYVAFWLATVL